MLQVRRARIAIGPDTGAQEGEVGQELMVSGRRVGTMFVPSGASRQVAGRRRLLAALASLLAVAIDRERLAREAYEAEALRRSDAVKTAVIQAVSHDLRTPLATIETALGSLQNESFALSAEDRAELLEAIAVEHARLKRLVENLLDLSRLQAGAARPAPALWTADQLVAQALEELAEAGRIEAVIPEDLPLVRVDAQQIQRVLVNLLENALKFSPATEPVHVRVAGTRRELVIRVIDHGSGIPEPELERIFAPFQRVAGERVRGAGLGLAIAKGFAEANGGRIWAESQAGQGASFTLALAAESPARVPA